MHCLLIRSLRLASFKVCSCVVVLSATVCTVGCVCLFRRDQIFVDFATFLSIYNLCSFIFIIMMFKVHIIIICSASFLDIRISTCFVCTISGQHV